MSSAHAFFNRAQFTLSAHALGQLPADAGAEIAFAGRSNVGKSSLINAVCSRRGLVKVSKTPGRTQALNVFHLDDDVRLVDLPGYGYAKAPLASQTRWQQLVERYLQNRQCLAGLVMIMDIRHPLQPLDAQMLSWAQASGVTGVVVLNKADKLKRGPAAQAKQQVQRSIRSQWGEVFSVSVCSAEKGDGIEPLRDMLLSWLAAG